MLSCDVWCILVVDDELKFIADTMLGDIARWLRMLGYDTLYSRKFTDNVLIAIAAEHGRILLTRDKGLARRASRKGIRVVYLPQSGVEVWLKELRRKFNIDLEFKPENTRCPICNAKLKIASRDEVKGKVPSYILEKYETYWVCPKCGKVYWKGTHWITIEKILKNVKESTSGG